jgi:hypothetical protein
MAMQNNEIALFQKFGLSKNTNFNYSEAVNAFIGNGYTSLAGNTYFNELRFIEGLLIKEDVGQGYAHTFLNGIRIFHIESKKLLCEVRFNCTYYNLSFIKSQVKLMLSELLIIASDKEGLRLTKSDVENKIDLVVEQGFATDQRKILLTQSQKYLNA